MTDEYIEFFLTAPATVRELELIELSHPDMSQTYRYVRNLRGGVSVVLPGDEDPTAFEYRPVRIRRRGERDDLAQSMSIDLGDPGELLAAEADALAAVDGFATKPTLRYWVYRSDDLDVPLLGPLTFEVTSISTMGPAATVEAAAPEKDVSTTGEIYTFARFPMLRGFL